MRDFILKFILPILASSLVFGAIIIYRDGWGKVSNFGSDPFAIIFYSLGAVSVPAAASAIVAGLEKLFKRKSKFINVWSLGFLVFSIIFALPMAVVAMQGHKNPTEVLSQEVIDAMKKVTLGLARLR